VSFGRRLVLFFLLIAIVPTAALIAILLFVSADSQRGKADARLAASLQTAVTVYGDRTADATGDARRLARTPQLALALKTDDAARLNRFSRSAVHQPGVVAVELQDAAGAKLATAGPANAMAFARVGLNDAGVPVGQLFVSTTSADRFATEVKRLTAREVVVSRRGTTLASTVPPPSKKLGPDETGDVTAGGSDYRAHMTTLNETNGESLLLLGPPKSGGVLGIGGPALAIMVWFLVAAAVLAWALSRTLTRLHQRVETQAVTDPLTGLWNRRYMAETLEREVARALRFGHPISLIILDVDDFKKINDRQGHLQGDIVLETVADVVRDATRSIDVASRYGGDELALVLVETGQAGAAILAERLAERMRENEVPVRDGGAMGVTLSIGVATIPESAGDLESLVDAADRALLRAKRAGKNQIRAAPAAKSRTPTARR
jgi:diguanylate cyclase (GGDEF)-like protein